jgi:hypothetical protein
MNKLTSLLAGMLLAIVMGQSALAQSPQAQRVVGTIAAVDGSILVIKTRQGEEVRVQVPENVGVMGVVKREITDIKSGDYVGVGGIPQPDGSQSAVRISILAASQRGANEGHRSWDGAPQGTMTNATVDTSVSSVEGQVLTVKSRDGERRVVVTPTTQITANVPGDKSELKAGANILITQAVRKPDGSLEAARVNVGRDGAVPQ